MHRRRLGVGSKLRRARLRGFVEQNNWRAARRDGGQLLVCDQKPRAGITYDVADLVGGEAVVDRQEHRADVAGCKNQFEERRAVLHQHRHHVAGAYTARGQPAGDPPDAMVEGGVGNILATVFERTTSRRSPGMKGDEA